MTTSDSKEMSKKTPQLMDQDFLEKIVKNANDVSIDYIKEYLESGGNIVARLPKDDERTYLFIFIGKNELLFIKFMTALDQVGEDLRLKTIGKLTEEFRGSRLPLFVLISIVEHDNAHLMRRVVENFVDYYQKKYLYSEGNSVSRAGFSLVFNEAFEYALKAKKSKVITPLVKSGQITLPTKEKIKFNIQLAKDRDILSALGDLLFGKISRLPSKELFADKIEISPVIIWCIEVGVDLRHKVNGQGLSIMEFASVNKKSEHLFKAIEQCKETDQFLENNMFPHEGSLGLSLLSYAASQGELSILRLITANKITIQPEQFAHAKHPKNKKEIKEYLAAMGRLNVTIDQTKDSKSKDSFPQDNQSDKSDVKINLSNPFSKILTKLKMSSGQNILDNSESELTSISSPSDKKLSTSNPSLQNHNNDPSSNSGILSSSIVRLNFNGSDQSSGKNIETSFEMTEQMRKG